MNVGRWVQFQYVSYKKEGLASDESWGEEEHSHAI